MKQLFKNQFQKFNVALFILGHNHTRDPGHRLGFFIQKKAKENKVAGYINYTQYQSVQVNL